MTAREMIVLIIYAALIVGAAWLLPPPLRVDVIDYPTNTDP